MKLFGRLGLLVLAGVAFSALAAEFPDHAVTMIVPFPPGGVADTVARPVADAMSRELQAKKGHEIVQALRRTLAVDPTASG